MALVESSKAIYAANSALCMRTTSRLSAVLLARSCAAYRVLAEKVDR
jgi:hypothetical protein